MGDPPQRRQRRDGVNQAGPGQVPRQLITQMVGWAKLNILGIPRSASREPPSRGCGRPPGASWAVRSHIIRGSAGPNDFVSSTRSATQQWPEHCTMTMAPSLSDHRRCASMAILEHRGDHDRFQRTQRSVAASVPRILESPSSPHDWLKRRFRSTYPGGRRQRAVRLSRNGFGSPPTSAETARCRRTTNAENAAAATASQLDEVKARPAGFILPPRDPDDQRQPPPRQ